jgi:hypothetical protein
MDKGVPAKSACALYTQTPKQPQIEIVEDKMNNADKRQEQ